MKEGSEKAVGIVPTVGNIVKKGFNYLTKPAGLPVNAKAEKAVNTAVQNAKNSQVAVDTAQAAVNRAGNQQALLKAQQALDVAKADQKIARAGEKAAISSHKPFTPMQRVAQTGTGVTGATIATGMATSGDSEAPAAPAPAVDLTKPSAADPVAVPKFDDEEGKAVKESINDILKLSGQRKITERDNVAGIVKPAEIKTLTESTVNECGLSGPSMSSMSTPASLSINATAGSGEEVANMLASIMKLAGVKEVTPDQFPHQEHLPMVKALDIMGGSLDDELLEPSEPDSMNAKDTVTVRNVDTGEEHEGRVKDATDEDLVAQNTKTGQQWTLDDGPKTTVDSDDKPMPEEYSNTPNDATDVPVYDPEKMAFRPNQAHQGDRMDGTMPKGVPSMKEDTQTTDLFKAYEAFKNGQ